MCEQDYMVGLFKKDYSSRDMQVGFNEQDYLSIGRCGEGLFVWTFASRVKREGLFEQGYTSRII